MIEIKDKKDNRIPIIVIVGPTAVGKSDLAVEIARWIKDKKFNGYKSAEIVSADSRQVYKGLDIGTGKITKREMRGIKHHLLDVADPRKRFTVVDYIDLAKESINQIASHDKLPIICGGTGFYISALLGEIDVPDVMPDEKLRKELSVKSADKLFEMLQLLDPKKAKQMSSGTTNGDHKNPRRLIRAIEIAMTTRENKMKERETDTPKRFPETTNPRDTVTPLLQHDYIPIYIGIKTSGDKLREKIRDRLIRRIKRGMIREVEKLHQKRSANNPHGGISWKRMEELGLEYRYVARYLQKKITKDEMIEQLSSKIWQYARRQMTWFKRNKKIVWVDTIKHQKDLRGVLSIYKKAVSSPRGWRDEL